MGIHTQTYPLSSHSIVSKQGPALFISVVFRTAFGAPFAGVPLIMGFSMGIWFIIAVGYGIPFMMAMCFLCGCTCKNPAYRNNSNNSAPSSLYDSPRVLVSNKTQKRNVIVYTWLNQIGLTEYHDVFVKEGYESLSDLQSITENDLRGMNITKQMHIKKILGKISTEKEMKNGTGTEQNSGENEGNVVIMSAAFDANIDVEAPPAYDAPPDYDAPPAYNNDDDITMM